MRPTVTKPRPKLVAKHLSPPAVEPVNAKQVKAHYVGAKTFALWQWVPGLLMAVLAISVFWLGTMALRHYTFGAVGEMACREGIMPVPEIHCEAGALDCLTDPTVMEVGEMQDAYLAWNEKLAKACIPVM